MILVTGMNIKIYKNFDIIQVNLIEEVSYIYITPYSYIYNYKESQK